MLNSESKIAVIGSGSWGTALVKLLQNNISKVGWWVRSQETLDYVLSNHRNPNYLTYAEIVPERLDISTNLNYIKENYDILVFAIPSAFLNDTLESFGITSFENKTVVSAIKGIVPKFNLIVAEYFHQNFSISYDDIAIIAGPCHAEEVAMQKLSFLTISCQDEEKAKRLSEMFASQYMRLKTSTDVAGTEYAAVLKNIYAMTNGICIGLGYGDNFQAVLMVNAMRELNRFLSKVFPQYRSFVASEYLGDLLVTSYSKFSRNRTFGTFIGRGYSVKSTMAEMKMIAEGYYATKCLVEINKEYEIDLPIIQTTYNILYEGFSPVVEMKILTDKLS